MRDFLCKPFEQGILNLLSVLISPRKLIQDRKRGWRSHVKTVSQRATRVSEELP